MAALMRKRAGFLIGDMLVGISFLTCFLVFSLPLLRTIQHEQDYSRLALWTYEAASVIAAAQDGALLENRPVYRADVRPKGICVRHEKLREWPLSFDLEAPSITISGPRQLVFTTSGALKGGMETIFLETNNRTEKREFTFEPVRGRLTYAAHLP